MIAEVAAAVAVIDVAYVVVLAWFCTWAANQTGRRHPGRVVSRLIPLSEGARQRQERELALTGRFAEERGISVPPQTWSEIAAAADDWRAAVVGIAYTWMWPLFLGLAGMGCVLVAEDTIPSSDADTMSWLLLVALLAASGFGYLDYRLAEPKLAFGAIFNEALGTVLLCAGSDLPRSARPKTRKQLVALGVTRLLRRLELYATRGFEVRYGGLDKAVERHVLQVAESVRRTAAGLHGPHEKEASAELARTLIQIMLRLRYEQSAALLPVERLDDITELPRIRSIPGLRVTLVYGITAVGIGAAAWILERLGAANAVPVVAGLLAVIPAITMARWSGLPMSAGPAAPLPSLGAAATPAEVAAAPEDARAPGHYTEERPGS